ncbi:hypothetical protein GCM10022627_00800 [Haloarcula argentinensis]
MLRPNYFDKENATGARSQDEVEHRNPHKNDSLAPIPVIRNQFTAPEATTASTSLRATFEENAATIKGRKYMKTNKSSWSRQGGFQ